MTKWQHIQMMWNPRKAAGGTELSSHPVAFTGISTSSCCGRGEEPQTQPCHCLLKLLVKAENFIGVKDIYWNEHKGKGAERSADGDAEIRRDCLLKATALCLCCGKNKQSVTDRGPLPQRQAGVRDTAGFSPLPREGAAGPSLAWGRPGGWSPGGRGIPLGTLCRKIQDKEIREPIFMNWKPPVLKELGHQLRSKPNSKCDHQKIWG